jgi:hypothetical protein
LAVEDSADEVAAGGDVDSPPAVINIFGGSAEKGRANPGLPVTGAICEQSRALLS